MYCDTCPSLSSKASRIRAMSCSLVDQLTKAARIAGFPAKKVGVRSTRPSSLSASRKWSRRYPLACCRQRDEISLGRSADKGPFKGLRKGEERTQQSQCLTLNRRCNRVTVAPHITIQYTKERAMKLMQANQMGKK